MMENSVATPIAGKPWFSFTFELLDAANASALALTGFTVNDSAVSTAMRAERDFLTAEDDPLLAELWDNEEDAVAFDNL